jgi:predicted dehydrogenase
MQRTITLTILLLISVTSLTAQDAIRIGIIGLDTSHVTAFTKTINGEPKIPEMQGCRVVAAFPHGSRDIESSYSRIPKFTEAIRAMDVAIVDSIDTLLADVDCVLLETNDGKLHLEQAVQVFRAGKPVFIDKPAGANLADVVAIYQAAAHYDVPMFSSSSLRYSTSAQEIRNGQAGNVIGCTAFSPCSLEPSHSRLFWYGIHGVELLFTCMGEGCESVSLTITEDCDVAVGRWADNRIGTFRGLRGGKTGYGAVAFGSKAIIGGVKYDGYKPLVHEIIKFFLTGESPIDPSETINLYAFMAAAEESGKNAGAAVTIANVMEKAKHDADKLLDGLLD